VEVEVEVEGEGEVEGEVEVEEAVVGKEVVEKGLSCWRRWRWW